METEKHWDTNDGRWHILTTTCNDGKYSYVSITVIDRENDKEIYFGIKPHEGKLIFCVDSCEGLVSEFFTPETFYWLQELFKADKDKN